MRGAEERERERKLDAQAAVVVRDREDRAPIDGDERVVALGDADRAVTAGGQLARRCRLVGAELELLPHEGLGDVEVAVERHRLVGAGVVPGQAAHLEAVELDPGEAPVEGDAVRQFEFQPPTEDGVPTPMWIKFVIKFRMY